ncbi:DUF4376 domain-containing protein [Pasteurella skyensis]|uniref:DUF4376 domain-containing protein n=1 Tax=Phocoenobacter skyensis TaxID=97481 RepID=UPI002743FF39|nr:DUF4376 domain-containing protein [Pasteurella skyensis]MDP8176357.1 DUF4376 domain-containing protein [Pasteurella skyensis]MDP8199130.1 DUF4376 domain-containing protein [Pasteurella skyensis]
MFYIFDKKGKNIGSCSEEPNNEDLATREEVAVEFNEAFEGDLILVDNKIVVIDKRPSDYHELVNNEWVLTQEAKAKKLKKEQKQAWENIKKYRDKLSQSGVKVGDKWFHSDEISHLRLMTLKQLPALPENLQWKTMDGSFVIMTEELLSNVINARLLTEIANFKNGERHKMLMLQSENPLEYDFSSGWCEIYEEVDDE